MQKEENKKQKLIFFSNSTFLLYPTKQFLILNKKLVEFYLDFNACLRENNLIMDKKIVLFTLFVFFSIYVGGGNTTVSNETKAAFSTNTDMDLETHRARLRNQTQRMEKGLKNFMKGIVKNMLPGLMNFDKESSISSKCMGAFMKYISGLASVKVWALQMLDSTSRPPAGILEGTLSDFGAFDQCLRIELPNRKGGIEFRGKYCAIEIQPKLPPVPNNFSLAKQPHAGPLDSIAKEFYIGGSSFHYLQFRLGICVPSHCTLEDMQTVAKQIGGRIDMDFKIPQCYVKEKTVLKGIHIAVICILCLLFLICIAGSVTEYKTMNIPSSEKKLSRYQEILACFSFISNYRRLISASKGSKELKALHGLRALSMAWVILGHTYVWTNFQLLRGPERAVEWFNSINFGVILNGWLSVEQFFFLSGFLTCYAVLTIMPKTKGRINVPIYILRRYIRLTPSLLLIMGSVFFLPVISSGPFWYEKIDPELNNCSKNWWWNILYINNWTGMENICLHPTWYLSADFQLHVISVVTFYILYWYPKLGLSLIAVFVAACSIVIGTLTYISDLPPIIPVSSGNNKRILDTLNIVHTNTFTHGGPYYIGIVTSYLILKKKDTKMTQKTIACAWLMSTLVALSSLYGAHRWNIGEPHGPLLTAIYAALHRTTFTMAVAWVAFACISGHGGLINLFLSSSVLAPLSRLTYLIYLIHPLVIWMRVSSMKERRYFSHYDMMYDYITNVVFAIFLSVPPYLLLEAPLSNLERLIFSKPARTADTKTSHSCLSGNLQENMAKSLKPVAKSEVDHTIVPVELMSVKQVDNGCRNLAFADELNCTKDE